MRKPKGWFSIKDAAIHNLKSLSVDFPLGVLTVIAGVAGSGKSSLMEFFQDVFPEDIISISQKNIGINLRSTPATYLDISDSIRKLFANENNVNPNLFSFNSKGACPACGGKGIIISEMAFMDTIETVCDVCHGKRFSKDVLKYTYHNKNIAEVMDFTVEEAIDFFREDKFIVDKLESLEKVGLGYLHLNQSMTTLSGGELQRVKLASQIGKRGSVFIIDEPTDGLHPDDVKKLMKLFNKLVDEGNSIFLVEHSIEVMKDADYIIELGPGGGISGGNILFSGTVKDLLNSESSVTRPYIVESLPQ